MKVETQTEVVIRLTPNEAVDIEGQLCDAVEKVREWASVEVTLEELRAALCRAVEDEEDDE